MKKLQIFLVFALLSAVSARALPLLQLDILGGIYQAGNDETVYATTDPFTLVALYNGTAPSGTYYISAAIVPKVGVTNSGAPTAAWGSFTVNGATYSSANMVYGGPPVDNSDVFPDLPTHGIYSTWFSEVGFTFNPANRATSYNTADHPGGLVLNASGGSVYSQFAIDTSGLNAGFAVHFDLYDENIHNRHYSVDFAPFSHDAQSMTRSGGPDGGGGGNETAVPDATSTFLLLIGALFLLGLLAYRRASSGRAAR